MHIHDRRESTRQAFNLLYVDPFACRYRSRSASICLCLAIDPSAWHCATVRVCVWQLEHCSVEVITATWDWRAYYAAFLDDEFGYARDYYSFKIQANPQGGDTGVSLMYKGWSVYKQWLPEDPRGVQVMSRPTSVAIEDPIDSPMACLTQVLKRLPGGHDVPFACPPKPTWPRHRMMAKRTLR